MNLAENKSTKKGLAFTRVFGFEHPFSYVEWITKDAVITNSGGEEVFRQNNVEVPAWWSETTVNIVAEKYFRIIDGKKETSAKQMFSRVATWLKLRGIEQGIFDSEESAQAFHDDLLFLLVNGIYAFNSPVWFNMGVVDNPPLSACYIQSVDDSMTDILDLAKKEVMLFKGGSGTGSNLSKLRSSYEKLSKGGYASGPVTFMEGYDAFAGATKSGGTTRRAAKMAILNIDHPDILTQKNGKAGFIRCKAEAEEVATTLYESGKYTAEWNKPGNVYDRIQFQNANNSVRVTDEFMNCVKEDKEWETKEVKTGKITHIYKARDLWKEIAKAAWLCGDPGVQFDTVTNDWHTLKESGRINASNPCVTGDTLIATSFGYVPIKELKEGKDRIVNLEGQLTTVANLCSTGIKPVYRLKTHAGYSLKLTADHKVWTTNRGDVEAHKLTKDDTVKLMGPRFGDYSLMEDIAFAVGIAVGDGCISKDNNLIFTVEKELERGIANKIAETLNRLKQNKCETYVRDSKTNTHIVSTCVPGVVEEFANWAVLNKGSVNKIFTNKVYSLNRESMAAMLRGLFTSDGTVANYSDKSQYACLDSSSLKLLQQVQMMLLQFGIKAKIYENRRLTNTALLPDGKGGLKEYKVEQTHSLRISRSSRIIFEKEIGFDNTSRKYVTLKNLNESVSCYLDKMEDTVESLEYLGEFEVFDLTEHLTNHFVANGIAVHNCSEFLHLDETSCNLGSLNLLRFVNNKVFDSRAFRHACEITTTAKEIIVDAASYPSKKIGETTKKSRPLGLGFTNLGALLTCCGIPYDSNEGRTLTSLITAIMTGSAYAQSARLAKVLGPFQLYESNKNSMLDVIRKHGDAVSQLPSMINWPGLREEAAKSWDDAIQLGNDYGFRNSQVTVIAPTGTISFLMGASTTGIEPMLGCIVYKKVVGEGLLKLPNEIIVPALLNLGYDKNTISSIMAHISDTGDIHSCKLFNDEKHGSIFAEALGEHAISPEAHVDMMAAVQPFISGGISKTVNMPHNSTPEDVANIYMRAWKSGLKCVAVFRDGCKLSQPISTKLTSAGSYQKLKWGERRKLPETRSSLTHKFSVGGQEGYIIVGLYPDGNPGELFIHIAKQGSTLNGVLDALATFVSLGLQHGLSLDACVEKCKDTTFDPSGFTSDPEIPRAKSLLDYIFRWLESQFMAKRKDEEIEQTTSYDGPPCSQCGNITKRAGSCFCCVACGTSTSCG